MADSGHVSGPALTGVQRVRLAAHILMSERHLRRVYLGMGSIWAYERAKRGAVDLGMPIPPEPHRRQAA